MKSLVLVLTVGLFTTAQAIEPRLIGTITSDSSSTNFGIEILGLQDYNGDGHGELIIQEQVSPFRKFYFPGSSTEPFEPELTWGHTIGPTTEVIDIDGDGYTEIACLNNSLPFKLSLYFGGPGFDTIPDLRLGLDTLTCVGPVFPGGDLNESGNNELLGVAENNRSILVFELGADPDSMWDDIIPKPASDFQFNFQFGSGFSVGDWNGDSYKDIAVSLQPQPTAKQNGVVYIYFGGGGFDKMPDLIIERPGFWEDGKDLFGELIYDLGDVNGDGFTDLFASSGSAGVDTLGFIYFGGPSLDSIPDVTLALPHSVARPAGDVNNDGYADLIVSRPTSWSTIGKVAILLGGSPMDSIPDVVFDVRDEPIWHDYYGRDCAGIGDFDGDGIDDFAFSAGLASNKGIVYIYAGWDSTITDVPYTHDATIPDGLALHQNFPNPFNPSTTIEFELPHRSHVALEVFNMLGQRVRILLNRVLPAGRVTVEWDGHNYGGTPVASGTYLYRLTAGEMVLSRKMVLLK